MELQMLVIHISLCVYKAVPAFCICSGIAELEGINIQKTFFFFLVGESRLTLYALLLSGVGAQELLEG